MQMPELLRLRMITHVCVSREKKWENAVSFARKTGRERERISISLGRAANLESPAAPSSLELAALPYHGRRR